MNELMKLPADVLDALNAEEMLFVRGGATMGSINNGSGSCTAINLGIKCNSINNGTSCDAINTGSGNCSSTNNSNSTCSSFDTNPITG